MVNCLDWKPFQDCKKQHSNKVFNLIQCKGSFNIYVDVTLLFLSASFSKHGPRNDNVVIVSNCTMILRGKKESKGSKEEKRMEWEKEFFYGPHITT